VKNKTQWQSSFRWYKCNQITKKEQHAEVFYTSTERGCVYDGEWIPEESPDEAFEHNDVVEEDSLDEVDVDTPLPIKTNLLNLNSHRPSAFLSNFQSRSIHTDYE
jgi:hypothetical protein